MKVIDLLNKIANGEEAPKKIKYNNKVWNYKDGIMEYISKDNCFGLSNFDFDELNEEVEVIEEDKKIERIKLYYSVPNDIKGKVYETMCKIIENQRLQEDKMNEIIDQINKED